MTIETIQKFTGQSWSAAKQGYLKLSQALKAAKGKDNLLKDVQYILEEIERIDQGITPDRDVVKTCISLFDFDLVDQLAELEDVIATNLEMITIVIGRSDSPPVYSAEDFSGKMSDYSPQRLTATFRETVYYKEDNQQFRTIILAWLAALSQPDRADTSWEEVFFMALMLDYLWQSFNRLDREEQHELLKRNYYTSIVFGLPVREVIKNKLITKDRLFDYIVLNQELSEVLSSNEEEVVVDGAKKKFADLLSDHLAGKSAEAKSKDRALVEALSIAADIQTASLIDWEKDRQVSEIENYEVDLVLLIASFGIGMEFQDIVKYSKQTETIVSLAGFINKLKEIVDTKDEKMVDRLSRLTEILQENKLLKTSQDIIIFEEKTKKFVWNEDLFV